MHELQQAVPCGYPETDPEAKGTGEILLECPYCSEKLIITLPRRYIAMNHLVRGLTSVRAGE